MSDSLKNILVLVVGVVLFGGGYFLLFSPSSFLLENANGPIDAQILFETQQFIAHRQVLEAVSLNTELFSDTRFTLLQSFASPVADQPIGKTSLFDGSQLKAATESN